LLLFHRKLLTWLPPGGHIEPHELPDDAARREVMEEAGVEVELMGAPGIRGSDSGRQLLRPEGIQVEQISPGHEHIDLIYFARPVRLPTIPVSDNEEAQQIGWYGLEQIATLTTPPDVKVWTARALEAARTWPAD
jgi:8-oxo-dGTP pyrophosphatase MutT (NUDIX family)